MKNLKYPPPYLLGAIDLFLKIYDCSEKFFTFKDTGRHEYSAHDIYLSVTRDGTTYDLDSIYAHQPLFERSIDAGNQNAEKGATYASAEFTTSSDKKELRFYYRSSPNREDCPEYYKGRFKDNDDELKYVAWTQDRFIGVQPWNEMNYGTITSKPFTAEAGTCSEDSDSGACYLKFDLKTQMQDIYTETHVTGSNNRIKKQLDEKKGGNAVYLDPKTLPDEKFRALSESESSESQASKSCVVIEIVDAPGYEFANAIPICGVDSRSATATWKNDKSNLSGLIKNGEKIRFRVYMFQAVVYGFYLSKDK